VLGVSLVFQVTIGGMKIDRLPAALAVAALLSACAQNGGNAASPIPAVGRIQAISTAATPAPGSTLPPTVLLHQGGVDGEADQFSPARGDTSSGGNGATVDGITCAPTMVDNQFHVHSYVGLIVDGRWIAVPDSIGMDQPGALVNGFVNSAHCFYAVHTHDASGMIHQEAASKMPESGSLFTLKNLFDIWGQTLTTDGFGPYPGVVHVFVAKPALRATYATNYSEFTGDPNTIKLYSHEAVWIEVGSPEITAAKLPPVRFYTEY
jgi:hypothetical protein